MAKYARKYKKRAYKRKRKSNVRNNRITRSLSVLPDKFRTKLPYHTVIDLSGGASSKIEHVLNLNSIFDVDFTGIGHQPLGHDQFAGLYNKYRVVSNSVRVQFCVSTTGGSNLIVGMFPATTTALLANDETICEQQRTRYKVVGTPSSNSVTTLRKKFYIKQLSGNDDNGNLQSVVGSNPAEQWHLHLFTQTLDKVSVPDVYCDVYMMFEVEFFDRLVLTQS